MRKSTYLILFSFFVILILFLFLFYNRYQNDYKEEQINQIISKNIDILYENLNFQKQFTQSLSLMLSTNTHIIKSLKTNDPSFALKEIHLFLKKLKQSTGIDYIDIQIHTKELRAFARSWENGGYFGTKLKDFRKGLVRVKKEKKGFVSIELGKRLNIKAIYPIFDKTNTYIGSIEVISSFKGLKKHLKKFNLHLIGLLEKRYLHIAIDLKTNKQIERYVVVEKNYDKKLYQLIKQHPYILYRDRYYYKFPKYIVTKLPMKNVGIDDIGIFILMMPYSFGYHQYSEKNYLIENYNYRFNNSKREVTIK